MISVLGLDTDVSGNQVTVILQYLVPSGSKAQQTNGGSKTSTGTTVVKATGLSIDDAMTRIQQATGKKLFYGYMQDVVLGETAARTITKDIIRYFDRTPNIRMSAYIAIAQGKAETVLNTVEPDTIDTTGKTIHNLVDQSINSGIAYHISILDFEEEIAKSGIEPVAPRITVIASKKSNSDANSLIPIQILHQVNLQTLHQTFLLMIWITIMIQAALY